MIQPGIEIKICGLTTPAEALACAAAGADAIGLVFHAASPRNLLPAQAQAIAAGLPCAVARVGIFVTQGTAEILQIAAQVGLTAVQVYGAPGSYDYPAFASQGLQVVQVLRCSGAELLRQAHALPANLGLLVECGRGTLPGGNGIAWNWSDSALLCGVRAFAVAGGLDAANVAEALRASGAAAVDVSSGVESAPGTKDLTKVTAFIATARACGATGAGCVFRTHIPNS